jgi:hypothetical protein
MTSAGRGQRVDGGVEGCPAGEILLRLAHRSLDQHAGLSTARPAASMVSWVPSNAVLFEARSSIGSFSPRSRRSSAATLIAQSVGFRGRAFGCERHVEGVDIDADIDLAVIW